MNKCIGFDWLPVGCKVNRTANYRCCRQNLASLACQLFTDSLKSHLRYGIIKYNTWYLMSILHSFPISTIEFVMSAMYKRQSELGSHSIVKIYISRLDYDCLRKFICVGWNNWYFDNKMQVSDVRETEFDPAVVTSLLDETTALHW